MKTLLFILFVLCISITDSNARNIKITKTGEGSGYSVTETHEDGGWFTSSKSRLTCVAPGPSSCAWTLDPRTLDDLTGPGPSNPTWDDLRDYAEDNISNNVLSGSHVANIVINGDLWYRSVTWSATNINNSEIEINIDLAP